MMPINILMTLSVTDIHINSAVTAPASSSHMKVVSSGGPEFSTRMEPEFRCDPSATETRPCGGHFAPETARQSAMTQRWAVTPP
jgi:hypothetical protein